MINLNTINPRGINFILPIHVQFLQYEAPSPYISSHSLSVLSSSSPSSQLSKYSGCQPIWVARHTSFFSRQVCTGSRMSVPISLKGRIAPASTPHSDKSSVWIEIIRFVHTHVAQHYGVKLVQRTAGYDECCQRGETSIPIR